MSDDKMTEDERYLRALNHPQDAWLLGGQQWFTTGEVAKGLGISDEAVRGLAEKGTWPAAVLHDQRRIGWRIPRESLIAYLARQRRQTEARRPKDSSAS